ncbi:MAG: hypothetical protein AB1757_04860 [Acidobacteriota bacterium]
MAVNEDYYKQAIEAVKYLSPEQRQQLIEELSEQVDDSVIPLALVGTWQGVSLSEEEINEARRECWASLGVDE